MRSEKLDKWMAAFVAAKTHIHPAVLNKINPHFKSRYADLASVLEATEGHLIEQSLLLTSSLEIMSDGLFVLITTLTHVPSDQWVNSTYPLPRNASPQEFGMGITYGRRYNIVCITNNVAEEDDDANAAQATGQRINAPPPVKTTNILPFVTPAATERQEPHPIRVKHSKEGVPNYVEYGQQLVAAIKAAETPQGVDAWVLANDGALERVGHAAPELHDRIMQRIAEALEKFAQKEAA